MHRTTKAGVTIHHNSGFDGEAIICMSLADAKIKVDYVNGTVEIRLPAAALAACGREKAISDAISALESLEDLY